MIITLKWINRIDSGVHEIVINRATEELIQYYNQLKSSLYKLDISFKYPENISAVEEIFQKGRGRISRYFGPFSF